MKKQVLAILLAICMVCTVLPTAAWAAGGIGDLPANAVMMSVNTSTATTNIQNPWSGRSVTLLFDAADFGTGSKGSSTKFGADVGGADVWVKWQTQSAGVPQYLLLCSGNDSGQYPGRAPLSYTLYASTTGEEESYTVISQGDCGMGDVSNTAFLYDVSAAGTAYSYYKIVFGTQNAFALNDILLYSVPAPTAYDVTVAPAENGTVSADVTEAAEHAVVTLTVNAAEGYELDSLSYAPTAGGDSVEITAAEGVYSFEMPGYAVTVSAAFAELPAEEKDFDLNGDEQVNLADLSVLVFHFNKDVSTLPAKYDLVVDGIIDVADLLALLSAIRAANPSLFPGSETPAEPEPPVETDIHTLVIPVEAGKTDFRVMLTSDIHNGYSWYGASSEDRMNQFVSAVKAEHEAEPFDLLLFLGDYSLDFWINGGSVLNNNRSDANAFINEIASELTDEIPAFFLPGNHEQYGSENWINLAGNDRYGTVVLGNNVFVMLDTFSGNLDPSFHADGTYTGLDLAYLEEQLAKYPDAHFYICAHYINRSSDAAALRTLCSEHPNVEGFFMGHDHKTDILSLGSECGNKTIAQTGNFAYGKGGSNDLGNYYWGFRELVITEDSAESNYIVAETSANIGGQPVSNSREEISPVVYYPERVNGISEINALMNTWNYDTVVTPSGTTVFVQTLGTTYDISSAECLKFDLTVENDVNFSNFTTAAWFEITSSGGYDYDESHWNMTNVLQQLGSLTAGAKVTVTLPFDETFVPETKNLPNNLDMEHINYLRWYIKSGNMSCNFTVDNFRFE